MNKLLEKNHQIYVDLYCFIIIDDICKLMYVRIPDSETPLWYPHVYFKGFSRYLNKIKKIFSPITYICNQ